jgi:hypothetical protein
MDETKFIRSGGLRLWTERSDAADAPAVLLVMGTSAPAIGRPDELVETLVEGGSEDPLRPLPHGEAVVVAIPGVRLRTVPGMGHGFFSPGLPRRVAGSPGSFSSTPPSLV